MNRTISRWTRRQPRAGGDEDATYLPKKKSRPDGTLRVSIWAGAGVTIRAASDRDVSYHPWRRSLLPPGVLSSARALRRAPARRRFAPRASSARARRRTAASRCSSVSVKPGQLDAYKETIEAHIVNCFANDRCMYFDYGVSDEEPDVVHLYETYEDQAALDEHNHPRTSRSTSQAEASSCRTT